MSGTVSTPANVMSTEIVENPNGLVTPAKIRDAIETMAAASYSTSQTASFAPSLTARGSTTRCNHATVGITVTINTSLWVAGYSYGFRRVGAATVTIAAGAGVTLISSSGTLTLRATGSMVWVIADTVSNTFYVDGDLS